LRRLRSFRQAAPDRFSVQYTSRSTPTFFQPLFLLLGVVTLGALLTSPGMAIGGGRSGRAESVETRRRFDVAPVPRGVGLICTHEGGFPIGWFMIGEGGGFSKKAVVLFS